MRPAGFQKLGVGPGVHVGLFLPNAPHYAISFFGVMMAGGTVVNYSPLDAAKVLEQGRGQPDRHHGHARPRRAVSADAPVDGPQRLKKLVTGTLAEMSGHPARVRAHCRAPAAGRVQADDFHMAFAQFAGQ